MDGVLKIGLHPVRTKLISGSKAFGISSLAIPAHDDKIIISGVRNQVTQATEVRGIFELNPANGESRVLALNEKPKARDSAWMGLAVSPDGRRAAAMRQRILEVIDLTDGSVRTLSPDLELGTWSPDGMW